MPKLQLVSSKQTGPKPARKLGAHGAELWRNILDEYDITEAGALEMLTQACQALDRAESLREQIDAEGEIHRSRHKTLKVHPALKHELAARQFVVRTLNRLGLDVEPIKAVVAHLRGVTFMPTIRHAKRHKARHRFTPEILDAFQKMEEIYEAVGEAGAEDSEEWWDLHRIVYRGLGLPPWQWPAFAHPQDYEGYIIDNVGRKRLDLYKALQRIPASRRRRTISTAARHRSNSRFCSDWESSSRVVG
jgi:hypothetical protein